MNIAYVTMAFPAASETFATTDVRLLSAAGATVEVHALRAERPEATRLLGERALGDIRITHHAGAASVGRGLLAMLRRPAALLSVLWLLLRTCLTRPKHLAKSLFLLPRVFEIWADLQRHRPDVVHAYWAHYPSLVVYLVQRYMPGVVTSISFSAYDIGRGFPVSGHVARRANVVRSLARFTAKEAATAFGLDEQRIEVIHDGVDLDRTPHDVRPRRVPRRIVTAGRLVASKGMDRVIEAFAALHERFPDATLHVLGTGPDRERLEAQTRGLGIAASVEFVGHVAQQDVFREMRQAEVFLFLSSKPGERLPNVVKEAMLSECICVVSRTGGIEELVEDGVTGFVVDHDDLARVVATIASVFDRAFDADSMTVAARAHVRRRFDARASVDRYLACWSEHMPAPSTPASQSPNGG